MDDPQTLASFDYGRSDRLVGHVRRYEKRGLERLLEDAGFTDIRPRVINRWLGVFSGTLVSPFCHLQRWFYDRDLGDGYVATAVKGGPFDSPKSGVPTAA